MASRSRRFTIAAFRIRPIMQLALAGGALLFPSNPATSHAQPQIGDWGDVIDQYWGPGAPVEEQLTTFDAYWERADTAFAAFASIPADWDQLRVRYRSEIEGGVSRGRFAAILNHLALALRESHTYAIDSLVNVMTEPARGVPLLVGPVRGDNGRFGACLTPLQDHSLLVYASVENHPLALEPGDMVVGYDGRPWSELYPELLAAELPLFYRSQSFGGDPPDWSQTLWGAAPSAYDHGWMTSAGLNWHLFDFLDVVRHGTFSAERVDIGPLAEADMSIRCTEQLPVPGVPFPVPAWSDEVPIRERGRYVSWGTVDGTRTGYIYVWSWLWGSPDADFRSAVETFVGDPTADGLIVDFRFNHGGLPFFANDGFALLFDTTMETVELVERIDPDDRFVLGTAPGYAGPLGIAGDPSTSFDRPIAILTGPGAYSAGDFNALRLRYHPRTRAFGKPTAAAFTPASQVPLPVGYNGVVAFANARRIDDPETLLVHSEMTPDEEVWLDPADVVSGEDTVVRRALSWIRAVATETEEPPPPSFFAISAPAPNPASSATTVWLDVSTMRNVNVSLFDLLGRRVAVIQDGPVSGGRHRINVSTSGLASGLYFLRATSDDISTTQRISVVR